MSQIIQLTADVQDAIAKAKLANLDIQADKLNQKKVTIKTDIAGTPISRIVKMSDGMGALVTTSERWTKSGQKITTVTQQVGDAAGKAGKQAQSATKAFTLLGTVGLRLAHTAISKVTRSFKDAFKEMQNVDKQLTTVSRVTQTNISDLDGLKTKAYEVGSAYGVMASDYLSGVAAFTRAGYKDQAEDLAELSTKMQVAGEVSAETANQLLIATDKAYGFNGSVTKLSSVMDKMTYVDHNYATSVEKIAEGMGIVAPVAAQAHMSVDELIASLGTITAVTQRSGSESARALRALILSIIKDTTTEVEEGVTLTVDEVNSVQDALKKYAPEVVKAAEATGELIDPMEAIAALSKSFEEGLLDEQGLAKITNALGGKLRASQLLSLIQNFSGMYTDMMNGMGNAIGIVDKDTQRYLDSWQGKLNQLKNSFAGFTESIFDTDAVKEFIDAINYLIKAIDNPEEFGEKFTKSFESAVKSLVRSLPRVQKAISNVALMLVKALSTSIKTELPTIVKDLSDGARQATHELSKELPEIIDGLMSGIGGMIGQSIVDADLAADIAVSLVTGIAEALPQAIADMGINIWDVISSGFGEKAKRDEFGENAKNVWKATWYGLLFEMGKNVFNKAEVRSFLHKLLPSIFEDVEEGTENVEEKPEKLSTAFDDLKYAIKDFSSDVEDTTDDTSKKVSKNVDGLVEKVKNATEAINGYKKSLEDGEKGDTLKSYSQAYKNAVELFNKGLTGTNQFMSAVDLLFTPQMMRELGWNYEKAGEMLSKPFFKALFEGNGEDFGANAANYIRTHQSDFKGVETKLTEDGHFSLMVTDMDAFAESVGSTTDLLWAFVDALDAWDSKTTYTKEELLDLVGATSDAGTSTVNVVEAVNKLFSDGKSEREVRKIIDSLKELAETDPSVQLQEPEEDLDQIISELKAFHDAASEGDHLEVVITSNVKEAVGNMQAELATVDGTTLTVYLRYVSTGDTQVHGHYTYATGTKSAQGGIALVNDGGGAELISANGKAWIAGDGEPTLTNLPQGATVFNAKQTREILTRSGIPAFDGGTGGWLSGIPITTASGGKVDTKKIEKILDELSKYVEKILKKAKEALDKQLKEIDAQIEALEREHDAEEDKNKLEELRLKILEAEKKLAEAENERTVRYFNKETGQWEWMADQKAVEDARKALQEAQEAYDKEVEEQAYQAQIQALKDLKEALQQQYEDLADHWEEIINAIKEAGEEDIDIEKLLKRLGLDSDTTGDIRELIKAIQEYERKLSDGTYEVPLDSATTAKMLGVSGMSSSGVGTLSQIFGMSTADTNSKGTSLYNMSTSNVGGDTNYYINGIKIGSDMMGMTLSQILSVLPIYANAN